MSEVSKTVFDQSGQAVGRDQTNIGSVGGDFNIGIQTTKADMGSAISALKADLASLNGVTPTLRNQINEALDGAAGVSPSPGHGAVRAKLDNAGNALAGAAAQLEGADDIAQKAMKLAKTNFSIGKWVVGAVT
jgi:hypothetical protein